ncbi:protein of unknown function [Burkholderia multivorans]
MVICLLDIRSSRRKGTRLMAKMDEATRKRGRADRLMLAGKLPAEAAQAVGGGGKYCIQADGSARRRWHRRTSRDGHGT